MPKTKRAPAQIVQCPHCNHSGSTRGLFAHIRLAHPGISTKPPISKLQHPYSLGNISPTQHPYLGKRPKGFIKSKRHRNDTSDNDFETLLWLGLGAVIVAWLNSNATSINKILPSEVKKPKPDLDHDGVDLKTRYI